MFSNGTQAYWRQVKDLGEKCAEDAELIAGQQPGQGFVYLTSIEDPRNPVFKGGRISLVNCHGDARKNLGIFIYDRSHRLATAEEITDYLAQQEVVKSAIKSDAASRVGSIVLGGK